MTIRVSCALLVCLGLAASMAWGQDAVNDRTCFQIGPGYSPELDIASDMAVVYGTGPDFAERAKSWQEQGYEIGMMTGIAWGNYEDYFGTGDSFKADEVQTRKDGSLWWHNPGTGYNVPTLSYIEYMKKRVEPAVDAGARIIHLEEPEYWAGAGWSPAFKKEWQAYYNEPWQEPDSSVDAQYRASKLKRFLYHRALSEVFKHIDQYAKAQGKTVLCSVPTHSLVSYAQWSIVSPESSLIDIPELDGYIAQVWTGTARSANVYAGVGKERTFETGYLEYGQMMNMVRPTGRRVWFLADPIEDNPNRSWNDYKRNYECTLVASLMWPEVADFEVMPWPDRIFNGTYPPADMDAKSGERVGIPPAYATEILTAINSLNEMDQSEVTYDTGSRGIGVIMSDTMMFQRAAPHKSEKDFGFFYGLTLPLVKAGVPVEPVQMENVLHPKALEPYRVLLLTYEGQKPLKPEYHDALVAWVKNGGGLIFIDDGQDPYLHVREWWNEQGANDKTPIDDLYARIGAGDEARQKPQPVGKGFVRIVEERASSMALSPESAERVRGFVREMLAARGEEMETQNYLKIQRGPFVVASVLDESVSTEPHTVQGTFVDLFDPSLPVVSNPSLAPDTRALYYDLAWPDKHELKAKVLGAGARVRNEQLSGDTFSFTLRGPKGTQGCARIRLPKAPSGVVFSPEGAFEQKWDEASRTLWLSFPNLAQTVAVKVAL